MADDAVPHAKLKHVCDETIKTEQDKLRGRQQTRPEREPHGYSVHERRIVVPSAFHTKNLPPANATSIRRTGDSMHTTARSERRGMLSKLELPDTRNYDRRALHAGKG